MPNEAFFKSIKEKMVKIDNPYLTSTVRDETQRIYDLSKFDAETVIMSRLVQNEELAYQDKIKLQTLVYNEKNHDFVVLFVQFLENYIKKQGGYPPLKEHNYCFMRDMMFRIMVRRLTETKDWGLILALVYVFQFIKYEAGGSVFPAKNDLVSEEIFQNDDFWLAAYYNIFSGYKNRGPGGNSGGAGTLRDLLMFNFQSLRAIRKSRGKGVEVMKRVMSLNFGFSIEYILDELENKAPPRNDLIFYKEADVESRKTQKIF